MKLTQLRNATLIVEAGTHRVLVDPMLAPAGAIPALKYATARRRRNPLVDLPPGTDQRLNTVTHALITHCQKGHFDHLDRAGAKWLRQRGIAVFCMEGDADFLSGKGLTVRPLRENTRQPFLGGWVTPVPCLHGRGLVGRMMAHGHGYHLEWPDEPSLYLAGDTLLTDTVRQHLRERRPAVTVIPAGGARFDLGGDIIMGREAALQVARLSAGRVVANHLEALDHCPVSRAELRDARDRAGLRQQLLIPEDGETLVFEAESGTFGETDGEALA